MNINKDDNSIIKQQLGYVFGIGGKPLQIQDLSWSLYHFNALYPDQPFKDLKDLGNPESFQYFFISQENFIEGRTKCFAFNGFNDKESQEKAVQEFDSFRQELFLPVNQIISIDMDEIKV